MFPTLVVSADRVTRRSWSTVDLSCWRVFALTLSGAGKVVPIDPSHDDEAAAPVQKGDMHPGDGNGGVLGHELYRMRLGEAS